MGCWFNPDKTLGFREPKELNHNPTSKSKEAIKEFRLGFRDLGFSGSVCRGSLHLAAPIL